MVTVSNIIVEDIKVEGNERVYYPFEGSPFFRPVIEGHNYPRQVEFDPFPGYANDIEVVEEIARKVTDIAPPIWDVYLYNMDREVGGRTNAWASYEQIYDYEKSQYDRTIGRIVLSGKRIPIHPGMTRHLVAHEYGHNLEYMLEEVKFGRLGYNNVVEEYAKVRGLEQRHAGTGGTWHSSPQEIFATDFRYHICNLEKEYWPHIGIPKIYELDNRDEIAGWWHDNLVLLATHENNS